MSAALPRRSLRSPELARTAARAATIAALGVLPPLLLLMALVGSFRSATSSWAIDFEGNFRAPAQAILHGLSPYHPHELARVHQAVAHGRNPDDFHAGVFVAYPAPSLLLGVPFTFLPAALAEWLWAACMLAAGGLALRIVGVRDWRVYGAVMLTPSVLSSVMLGAVDLALVLGLAACWRWRDHAGRAGVALGACIALKLIAAPLIAWLLVTRRWGAAAMACAVSAGLCLAGWAVIGFDGLRGYPHLLSMLTDIESARGYSAVAYAHLAGITGHVAAAMPYALGACLLGLLWKVAGRRRGGDEAAFLVGVLALVAFSPIVWHHYLVLLFVPLAVYAPRFSPIWLLPLLGWAVALIPSGAEDGTAAHVVFLAVIAGATAWMLTSGRKTASGDRPPAGTLPAWR